MQITENRIRNEINCAQTQLFGDGRREISWNFFSQSNTEWCV